MEQVFIGEDSLLIETLDTSFQEEQPKLVPSRVHGSSWKKGGTFGCTECDETFRLKVRLAVHMREEHPSIQMEDDGDVSLCTGSLLGEPRRSSEKQDGNRKVFTSRKTPVKESLVVSTGTKVQPGFSLLLK